MLTRRTFLKASTYSLFALSNLSLLSCGGGEDSLIGGNIDLDNISALLPPDINGIMLPQGFTSRVIASSGEQVINSSSYLWHDAPDGAATFATNDGGWIYVSNSELRQNQGSVGAIRFNQNGDIIDSYSILQGTNFNCSGSATPWGTWLSCEEQENGVAWECDPYGLIPAVRREALGIFAQEAIAFDANNHLYITEDRPDGCLYRFNYSNNNLSTGLLEVGVVGSINSELLWQEIPDTSASSTPLRLQVDNSFRFNGAEGIVYDQGEILFSTKGDNKIWSYNTTSNNLSVRYDMNSHPFPILSGVDNMTLGNNRNLLVAEDGGDMQIVVVNRNNELKPFLQLMSHTQSEITGIAFSPNGNRFYFSSQRGSSGRNQDGITYEITRNI